MDEIRKFLDGDEIILDGDEIIGVGAKPKDTDKPNEQIKSETFKRFIKENVDAAVDFAKIAGSGMASKKAAEAIRVYAEALMSIEEAGKVAAEKERLVISVDNNISVKDMMALFGAITELHELTSSVPPRIESINIGHKTHEPSPFHVWRSA